MNEFDGTAGRLDTLIAARKIANFASSEGLKLLVQEARAHYTHLGALLADSVLQAGLNYKSVVQPRVERIFNEYPHTETMNAIIDIVNAGGVEDFLNWKHHTKIGRFSDLARFLYRLKVMNVADLHDKLQNQEFCADLQNLNGIGPKTVDYMICLTGQDSIPVDRHIRSFALRAGVHSANYDSLRHSFCFAADLLAVPRRDFDALVWRHESQRKIRVRRVITSS